MDDVLGPHCRVCLRRDVTAALCQTVLSRWQAGQQSHALLLKFWPNCLCNVLRDAPSERQVAVGGVDNGCDLLLGQVALHHLQSSSSPSAFARLAMFLQPELGTPYTVSGLHSLVLTPVIQTLLQTYLYMNTI